jgi:predicted Zn finger-like uncharacterized protein
MITACPNCNTRFLVADTDLGNEGRKVRCGSCSHVWMQEPEYPVPKPERQPASRTNKQPQKPAGKPLIQRLAWPLGYAATGVLMLCVLGLSFMPIPLTTAWPPLLRLYDTLGMPVPALGQGLALGKVDIYKKREEDAVTLLVHGTIANVSAKPLLLPNLLITVRDVGKRPLLQWIAQQEQGALLNPGESIPFLSQRVLHNQLAASLHVTFTSLQPGAQQ